MTGQGWLRRCFLSVRLSGSSFADLLDEIRRDIIREG